MGSTSIEEVPEAPRGERLVGGDCRVLPIAVVGIEQVELEVLGRQVQDPLTVEHDAQHALPGLDPDAGFASKHPLNDPAPLRSLSDIGLEVEPGVEQHLDRPVGTAVVEKLHDILAEGGPIHAEFQGVLAAQSHLDLLDEVAEEGQGSLAVVDVPARFSTRSICPDWAS